MQADGTISHRRHRRQHRRSIGVLFLPEHLARLFRVGDDDEDMPPLYFDTPEEACRAYALSEWLREQRAKRREEALRRLGKR